MAESSDRTGRPADPSAAAVRAALDRALASDALRGAPQLSAFLSFVVERCLEGRGAELKGYTIAVEAFGRPPEFDPQADPIVRVEAGRLRRALGQYYAYEGASDPVRITMPVGAYVPVFELVEAGAPGASRGLKTSDRAASWRWLVAGGLALALGLAALLLWYGWGSTVPAPAPDIPARQTRLIERSSRLPAPAGRAQLPVVAVTVSDFAADPALDDVARAFTRLLVDALARFDDLLIVRAPSSGVDPRDGADYELEMSALRSGEAIEGFGRLRSIRDGRIVWTASTTRVVAGGAEDQALVEIARRLAIRLAEPFGIIHADFRLAEPSSAARCILLAFNFRRTMKPEEHLAARICLDGVIERDPSFHPAWSQLALLALDEYMSGLNPLPGPALDRALAAALTAIRLAPSSARAHQALMDVHFARGATGEALRAGQEAASRNPYDPDIMADLGARYVQLNRPAEGLPLLQRAVELSSGRPPWYDFFAYLGAHLTGASKLADAYAAIFVADDSAFSLLGRALQCSRMGDEAGLQASLRRLARIEPLAGVDIQLFLARKGFSPVVVDRLIADLGPRALEALVAH